ncbi:conjugative transposon TraM protein [Flavobacterium sp. 90]|uniref:conjugative transposon protein TraM n=1 Tax=unclassified Flavobacterium TaxID=196869 RepID=UPI000EAD86A9|nr:MULTISPECIES: conjugative transposon protein TraM [unclassified Flavobacterium]RKR08146.1 conjugative transposon TraM protein [Flavobacterium sp. 81]TCK57337.1 conjugative transposon TraM protein [Flavobacterium sp. 90]
METKTLSIKEVKKRKMLLVLPLITLPFITLLFYVLGGGRMEAAISSSEHKKGFNFKLPMPKFKEDSALDKLSYYDQAATDSLKLLEQIKKDPNYSTSTISKGLDDEFTAEDFEKHLFSKGIKGFNSTPLEQGNEKKIYEKIKALQKIISQPVTADSYGQDMSEFESYGRSKESSQEIKNLERMMASMGAAEEPDPELQQLGGMLENILDIQHPQRVQEKLKQSAESKKGKVFTVDPKKEIDISTSLQNTTSLLDNSKSNSFYSADESAEFDSPPNAVQAVIHEMQIIVNGSIVKLRLSSDINLQGTVIPKNTFLYGMASLKGERLEVKVDNIQFRNSIFPVELTVYDLDGISGIYIPGAINRDVAKASADRSIQTLGLTGVSDSWGAQAAGMGVEAAKSLLSKKVKLIKVVLKSGYQVLLYDEKQKNLK